MHPGSRWVPLKIYLGNPHISQVNPNNIPSVNYRLFHGINVFRQKGMLIQTTHKIYWYRHYLQNISFECNYFIYKHFEDLAYQLSQDAKSNVCSYFQDHATTECLFFGLWIVVVSKVDVGLVVVVIVGINVVVDVQNKSDDRGNKTHVTKI